MNWENVERDEHYGVWKVYQPERRNQLYRAHYVFGPSGPWPRVNPEMSSELMDYTTKYRKIIKGMYRMVKNENKTRMRRMWEKC